MSHIFISYSHDDTEIMYRICHSLEAENFKLWTDEQLEVGTPSWQNAIENAIENANCLIVILSPHAKKSKWVREELNYAVAQNKAVFPILAWGNENEAVPIGYMDAQWIDIRDNKKFDQQIAKLIKAIKEKDLVTVVLQYLIGIQVTVYEIGALMSAEKLLPLLEDFWVFPETKALNVLDVTRLKYEDLDERDYRIRFFEFNSVAIHFKLTHYTSDTEYLAHVNVAEWLTAMDETGKFEIFRRYWKELYNMALDSDWHVTETWDGRRDIKSTSFLTLWQYTSKWKPTEDFPNSPYEGDYLWELLGQIDATEILKKAVSFQIKHTPVDTELVRSKWGDVQRTAKKYNPFLPALLSHTNVLNVEGNLLALDSPNAVFCEKLMQPDKLDALLKGLFEIFGINFEVEFYINGKDISF